ncbi:4-(cytidine 5'-diphospho)-2-C-methyl-D-erythritol kinase [Pseudidiomarina sp. 1APP75-32.1]|uniref:4-diphosphocytidyl-2-C-methyl-D-erythritol kinase n=1 Tax=Pseudidiomarina terrestris TaxID=2820060 RepID=A0AAW7QYI4_9GAMM|nr:4-(cytidine 5'-diphospho)-2-C-methyl-D-erythritol kinase [Pseudidiomarina sp. 1APP75-32.1]MDN7127804.1 4-(cytidine 5'-diphospho)-2-C-methyl-D-erythritol kinase [Pseudidiomarina sp. 1APR75-33.1]MDN7128911.1 4-(cytidine 5'-diphospho)-2-C-methyl-D-erythritol kinase [Pseudidiomarina sp. 1APR75-15]MDN7137504.1 4-(cytidine 5'-diphospho)-2-C-methyl-D-erythritol kinase [Pseudidiomarina sp. 1ASP75-14]MEA3587386.1 4-(cytidine 5'-diphospho)-2-C-methyl-D-erythritol kinase [Pseudidiomarina sp. 1APP75-27a
MKGQSVETLVLPAPAKLNLFLHITGRRSDGYHELQTVFQFLDRHDSLSFTRLATAKLDFQCSDPQLENDDNLVVRAARALQDWALANNQPAQGARIILDKRLPYGGGLGGGSSDAATTLLALRQLWQLSLSTEQLAQLGLQLGADVPVFIHGHAAFAEGVGERLTPVAPASPWYLVVDPKVHIRTATIFQHPELRRDCAPVNSWDWSTQHTENVFEPLVRRLHPEVANALDWLVEYAPTRLTGTGACLFGSFESQEMARAALARMPAQWTGFVARGLNESPVCQQLRQASTDNLTNHD